MREQIRRLGLPSPHGNSFISFERPEEKGGCEAQKAAGWLCKVHQTSGFAQPDPGGHHAAPSHSYGTASLGARDPATTFFNLN